GAALTFVNNTVVGISVAAFNFSEPELNPLPGLRATLDGNILFNPPGFSGTNFQNRASSNGVVQLVLARNLFSAADAVTNGVDGNFIGEPRLANADPSSITADSIRSNFSLGPGSPAVGTGPNGLDRGALVPSGASISGEPVSPTPQSNATLVVAGPGISNYVFRVNGAAYGSERSVETPIVLSGLANGNYKVEVLGRNSAGVLQSVPTVSRTWTVNTGLEH